MNSRERVKRALNFQQVDRIPRDLWALPGVKMYREGELEEIRRKYPGDLGGPSFHYGEGSRCKGEPWVIGHYIDAWGSEWHVGEPGVAGEVKVYPLADWSALQSYLPPWEILEKADIHDVNRSCAESERFILAGSDVRPFERMQFLRGTENLMIDLAYGESEVFHLRDMLHEYNLRELTMWADTDVDGVSILDDWGSQNALLISPVIWRAFFKPLYKEYCEILRRKGKYVFFHSDGNIQAIYPDLIEIGVNAVNSQLFCMDIEELGKLYSGKITFWGEMDRQFLLPFGTVDDVRKGVQRVAKALIKDTRTGVIAQCEWGVKDPKVNIETVFEEWNNI